MHIGLIGGIGPLQPTIPHLTRSSLHRCLQRHGIARLPQIEGDKRQLPCSRRELRKGRRADLGAIGRASTVGATCSATQRSDLRENHPVLLPARPSTTASATAASIF
jgi:hypothetical protein